jgi:cyclopropane-fatty-acyl-phospholipid synthase
MLAAEREITSGLNGGAARWRRPALAVYHALRRNTRSGSRRNIAAHYDLGNEFFELFLDPTLTYSSGIFETPEATMEEASIAKYERCVEARAAARRSRPRDWYWLGRIACTLRAPAAAA